MQNIIIEPVCNFHCACGENPLWNIDTKQLFWTDIPTGRLFRYTPATDTAEQIYSGPTVGGFTFQESGELLLFRDTDIAILRHNGKVDSVIRFTDHSNDVPRFNDVIADPTGSVFAGTMGKNQQGGVWQLDHDRKLTNLWRGTNCSNGMAFTPDLATFYWTSTSPDATIYAFDYNQRSGKLAKRRAFLKITDEPGGPDGLTIDTNANLYSARYGGSGVFIYSPAAKLVEKIEIPAQAVTSCIFAGPNLDTLYVTTAQGKPDDPDDTPAGTLYRVTGLNARGLPEFRSRIQLG